QVEHGACVVRNQSDTAKDALIYSAYPSPHRMRAAVRRSGDGRLAVCLDAGAERCAHTVRPQRIESNDGVTSRRPAGCAAWFEQTAKSALRHATHPASLLDVMP